MISTGSRVRARTSKNSWERWNGVWLAVMFIGTGSAAGAAEPEWVNIGPEGQFVTTIGLVVADHFNRSPAQVTLYAGTSQSGIFRSLDQGATWVAVNGGLTNLMISSLAIHQRELSSRAPITRFETVIYARTSRGAFRSVDGGASWTAVSTDLGPSFPRTSLIFALAVDPAGTVYIGTRWGAFKSVDRGDTWTPIAQGTGEPAGALAIDGRPPVTLYFNIGGRLVKSSNGGDDWTDILPREQRGFGFSGDLVSVDPFSETVYAAGGILFSPFQGLTELVQYRSRNGGESWTSFRDLGSLRDVLFLDESTVLASGTDRGPSGTDSGLFRSTDGGATWQPTNAGFPIGRSFAVLKLASDPVSPGTVYAATTQGVFRSGPAPDSGLPRVVPKRQALSSQVDR